MKKEFVADGMIHHKFSSGITSRSNKKNIEMINVACQSGSTKKNETTKINVPIDL